MTRDRLVRRIQLVRGRSYYTHDLVTTGLLRTYHTRVRGGGTTTRFKKQLRGIDVQNSKRRFVSLRRRLVTMKAVVVVGS